MPDGDDQAAGPGAAAVPRVVVILLAVLLVLTGLIGLYSLWACWPTTTGQTASTTTQRVTWLGLHFRVNRESLFFLIVALSGGLGGLVHAIRSYTWYVGNRRLVWSWVPYNILLPVVGSLSGTVFYLVLRAGLFSPSTSVSEASPFGFAAIAILCGLFSPEAFEKLRLLATDIFTHAPAGEDHVGPTDPG